VKTHTSEAEKSIPLQGEGVDETTSRKLFKKNYSSAEDGKNLKEAAEKGY